MVYLEHPDITRTMRTGYPNGEPKIAFKCDACPAEIHEGEEYVEYDGERFCGSVCLGEHLVYYKRAEERIAGQHDWD